MKPIIRSNFGFKLEADFDKQVEIWIDNFSGVESSNSEIKIFVQIEPNEIMGLNQNIISNSHLFSFVFSYEEDVLNSIKNGVLFEYGTKWIDVNKYDYKEKEFSISTVCGHKTITKNHHLRQKLWYKQNRITVPKKFFVSKFGGVENFDNNPTLFDEKEPMFNGMYHICIENVSKNNFFTEKLIDCLLCKCIPIYVGCPNIKNYFNMDGFIVANTAEEVISLCNNLTPEFYNSRLVAIEQNKNTALVYADFNNRLINSINKNI